jgi:two-component system, NtrC family, sensor kinase
MRIKQITGFWRKRHLPESLITSTIQTRLIKGFSLAILIPALIIAVVGGGMLERRVFDQAQDQVNADLEAAKVIYQQYLERLKDALRIHATRMIIYGALSRNEKAGLGEEMERIRKAELLDVLTLTDAAGRIFYRTRNPAARDDQPTRDRIVEGVLKNMTPLAGTEIVSREELEKESEQLARQAFMATTPTPRASPTGETQVTSGMMLWGAAPVFTPDGRRLGVLYGGVLLNRNNEIVDKVRETVFKEQMYKGREMGTATIFQGDVRISTNVKNSDGSRAITTRASAEVAEEVLGRGATWRGRAFVVNDWYLAAYSPINDLQGERIGMLYVGILERPFTDSLWRSLYVFMGISVLGVALMSWVAVNVARKISHPIHAMAEAAQKVAQGDYSQKVEIKSDDEVGYLAQSFNTMTSELERAHQELREWTEKLERKVEQRTTELRTMQGHLLQTEKMAAIGKLAAGVAHEINNPLTGVLTNSSLMLKDLSPDDPWREDLQGIVNETLRCRKIVKGLLDFARQTKPQKQSLNLNQIVTDVLALVRNQASFRDVAIQADLDTSLPSVMADGDQMKQVFLNIVLNAADAMPRGGELRILSSFDPARKTVTVRISDTGMGIPEEMRDRLFEPFATTKKTGTGLGLAVAYGIVERHKGTLNAESAPGRGATFIITLPSSGSETDD